MPRMPFRAEHIGSFLRPAEIKAARAKRERGEISAPALREIEDRAIDRLIAQEEANGIEAITDGEFRRGRFADFLALLDGVKMVETSSGIAFQNVTTRPRYPKVVGKISLGNHPMIADFAFLKAHAGKTPKMTMGSPTMLCPLLRDRREVIDRAIYPTDEELNADIAKAYRDAIRAFYDAGCRYLQLDECNLSVSCDPSHRAKLKERGEDPEKLIDGFVKVINDSIADKPDDMLIAMHHCRGNFRSKWMAEGGYEPVADVLFNRLKLQAHFMEFDDSRSGGFEPLRLVPKGTTVVLGLISSKTGALEDKDQIKRRIDEAAKYVDLAHLCLSPQCGFASTEEGNELSEEDQWAKLRLTREIAEEVWGRA